MAELAYHKEQPPTPEMYVFTEGIPMTIENKDGSPFSKQTLKDGTVLCVTAHITYLMSICISDKEGVIFYGAELEEFRKNPEILIDQIIEKEHQLPRFIYEPPHNAYPYYREVAQVVESKAREEIIHLNLEGRIAEPLKGNDKIKFLTALEDH